MFVFLGLGVEGLTFCEVNLKIEAEILKVFEIIFLFENCLPLFKFHWTLLPRFD